MKVLTAEQIRQADQYTIEHEPISSTELMERAASKCADWLLHEHSSPINFFWTDTKKAIKIFCGTGNNGGDGLVIARKLAEEDFPNVSVYLVLHSEHFSPDFQTNMEILLTFEESLSNLKIDYIREEKDFPALGKDDIIIDAIFGSGLNKPITGFVAQLIEKINESNAQVIAIDMPSGLFVENNADAESKAIIKANHTLSFQFPKLSFLYDQNHIFTGQVHILSIYLHPDFIAQVPTNNFILTKEEIKKIVKSRNRVAHKGNFGHALLIAGSEGKMGAAVLAAKACLRAGIGLLTLHIPKIGYQVLQTTVPEAMVGVDKKKKFISNINAQIGDLDKYTAIGIGCGIGKHEKTGIALLSLLKRCNKPIVIDADALNILAENPTWWEFIPKNSILTPHPKEFERLFGRTLNPYLRHQLQLAMSKQRQIFIILKGATTCISTPEGLSYFNSEVGNSGMATGGSGDVLTGVLTSLLAQGYAPLQAALLGVYLHGLAGDAAKNRLNEESMIASDIIRGLPRAFNKLKEEELPF
ncbi:MAG: NAD(P)H-hydrate dehydratase [Cytophagales bacterium]|nr:MAG: NAD(P)H-hydrate dehydratase [Cytophagales bacterium]